MGVTPHRRMADRVCSTPQKKTLLIGPLAVRRVPRRFRGHRRSAIFLRWVNSTPLRDDHRTVCSASNDHDAPDKHQDPALPGYKISIWPCRHRSLCGHPRGVQWFTECTSRGVPRPKISPCDRIKTRSPAPRTTATQCLKWFLRIERGEIAGCCAPPRSRPFTTSPAKLVGDTEAKQHIKPLMSGWQRMKTVSLESPSGVVWIFLQAVSPDAAAGGRVHLGAPYSLPCLIDFSSRRPQRLAPQETPPA